MDLEGTPALPEAPARDHRPGPEFENYLWPDAITAERKAEIGGSEIVQVCPHRHSVPTELWNRLLDQDEVHIEILLYAGMFLTDDPTLIKIPCPIASITKKSSGSSRPN